MLVAACWPALIGSDCSPSEPGCDYAGACDDLLDPVRSCINFCAERWDPSLPPEENLCAVDPCDAELLEDGARVCPRGYYCEPDVFDPRRGRCTESFGEHLQACAGVTTTCVGDLCQVFEASCETGTTCTPVDCPRTNELLDVLSLTLPEGTTGVCSLPVREGEECDSNMSDDERGCAPCEDGTFCLEGSEVGMDFDGRRCVRRCEDAEGAADPGLCGCSGSACRETDAVEGEDGVIGSNFCEPCIAPNAGRCSADADCCDGLSCNEVLLDPATDASARFCCLPEGASCQEGAGPDPCCFGTRCAGGEYGRCGLAWDDATELSCCEGFVPVEVGQGVLVCQPCASTGFDCGPYSLVIRDESDADPYPVPDTDVPFWRAGPAIGGDLTFTAGTADRADYFLDDAEHRAYVFADRLTSGVGPETSFLQLGQPGGPQRDVPLPAADDGWRSARIYDIGECSYLARWTVLGTVIGLGVNQQIADVPNADPLAPIMRGFTLTPTLRADPLRTTMPRGEQRARDTLELRASFNSASIGGCEDVRLDIVAELAVEERPAYIDSPRTRAIDTQVQGGVGCTVMGSSIRCTEIDSIDAATRIVYFNTFDYPNPVGFRADINRGLAMEHGCSVETDTGEYACTYFRITLGAGALHRVSVPRPAVELSHASNWTFRPERVTSDITDVCFAEPFIRAAVESRVRQALSAFDDQINELLGTMWGDSLIDDYGVPPHLVPSCGLLPSGEPDHWACRQDPLFGGRRHRCVDRPGRGWICDGAQLEVRRMHVRPEGLEIILSEGPDDPQGDLLAGQPGLIRPGSFATLIPGGVEADPPVCDSNRSIWDLRRPLEGAMPRRVGPILPVFPAGSTTTVCSDDAVGCAGICSEFGTTCALASIAGLHTILGGDPVPMMSVCNRGVCSR